MSKYYHKKRGYLLFELFLDFDFTFKVYRFVQTKNPLLIVVASHTKGVLLLTQRYFAFKNISVGVHYTPAKRVGTHYKKSHIKP